MVPNIQESIGAYEARHAACSCEAMTPRPGSSGRAGADGAGGLNVTSVLGSANGVTLGESRSFMLSAEVKF